MSAWQGQQYNHQYQQQPWQPPASNTHSSWQDPRFANQTANQNPYPLAAHTPLSPTQAYNVPNAPTTSNWGVRYNQTAQPGYPGDIKPPLPPRPTSGLAHNPLPAPVAHGQSWQAPTVPTPIQQTQNGYVQDHRYGTGQQWPPGAFPNQQSQSPSHYQPHNQSPAPPVPPPRPSAYQSQQAQLDQWQWSQQQNSHHTPLHNQDPVNAAQSYNPQQAYPIQQPSQGPNLPSAQTPLPNQAQTARLDQRPPVSPEATHAVPWNSTSEAHLSSQHSRIESGSSALGSGGPSDWEHFQGSVGDAEEEGTSTVNSQNQWRNPALNHGYAELPTDFVRTASIRESSLQTPGQDTKPKSPVPTESEAPTREHSVSPEPSREGLRRTGTIDGVIQAWNTPLNSSGTGKESRKSSVSTLDRSRRDAPESIRSSPRQAFQKPQANQDQASALRRDSFVHVDQEQSPSPSRVLARQTSLAPPPLSTKTIEVDPYADLGPEYRASLARYATVFRKEEAAPEEEKYSVFEAFVRKETRLRSILYGVETDDVDILAPSAIRAKEGEHENFCAEATSTKASGVTPSLPFKINTRKTPDLSHDSSPKLKINTTSAPNDDSYVIVEQESQAEYSPGGRPRMSRNAPQRTASHPQPKAPPKVTNSPSDYAPILVDEELRSIGKPMPALAQGPPPRPGTAPSAMRNGVLNDSIKFEPSRPAYTPFRYAEGPRAGLEPSLLARPAYQAYSALRHQSVDSGRVMAQSMTNATAPVCRETLASPTGNSARREHEEAFLGLIREKSRAYRGGKQGKAPTASVHDMVPLPGQVDRRTQVINGLRKIIPKSMPQQRQPSRQIVEMKHTMSKYPEVFTWISETVITWDRENRVIRKKQEDRRQARQEESERNIDALFNDHEIGYSDIGQLESDFKLAEATKKYDDDVQELETFTDKVFKPVTEHLQEDLVQLNAQYTRAVDVLELEADSGSPYIHGTGDRASRSEAMEIVLALYNKLQIRYVKAAEAHYERERRRKKLELSVLYTNGDTAAMRKLEQTFSKAERQQTLHDAQEKDSRANQLMDTFDRATVGGLGDNQQFVDDVVSQLQSINDLFKEKQENVTELVLAGLNETLRSTEELIDYVGHDSKSLLMTSNKADNLLNSADYEVSVAAASVANATPESMRTLEEEKRKEDERIRAEGDTRMGSVAKGPENALSLLRGMMKRIGDDPQHQDRVQKALEAAKLRNASKTPVV